MRKETGAAGCASRLRQWCRLERLQELLNGSSSRRVVFATFGSRGDLHPYLALALEMKRRGHRPVIATLEMYRSNVEACGLEFCLLRSALAERPDSELMRKVMDLRSGAEYIVRTLMMPALETAYSDATNALQGASLLVSHPLTYGARLAAESRGLPWVSTQLAPMSYLSAYDPPVLPVAPFFGYLPPLGPAFFKQVFALTRWLVRSWTKPYRRFRAALGLPPGGDPIFSGGFSPWLDLALFSRVLGERQPDWPSQTVLTGFPFFDGMHAESVERNTEKLGEGRDGGLSLELRRFLDAGEPPIAFTLGTSAVMDAGRFYEESALAAERLGKRAVLLVGSDPRNVPTRVGPGIFVAAYAPFSLLFPRTVAIVHQGGVGTTGQVLRAGKPSVIVPYTVDQPDNAMRAERLGVSRTIPKKDYTAQPVAAKLAELLGDASVGRRALQVKRAIESESGATAACDALEDALGRPARVSQAAPRQFSHLRSRRGGVLPPATVGQT